MLTYEKGIRTTVYTGENNDKKHVSKRGKAEPQAQMPVHSCGAGTDLGRGGTWVRGTPFTRPRALETEQEPALYAFYHIV